MNKQELIERFESEVQQIKNKSQNLSLELESFYNNTETDLYRDVETYLGASKMEELEAKSQESLIKKVQSKLKVDKILKEGGDFDYGDSVYSFNYFGFTIEENLKSFNLNVRTKFYKSTEYNPYYVQKFKKLNKEQVEEIMLKESSRMLKLGVVVVPLNIMIDNL